MLTGLRSLRRWYLSLMHHTLSWALGCCEHCKIHKVFECFRCEITFYCEHPRLLTAFTTHLVVCQRIGRSENGHVNCNESCFFACLAHPACPARSTCLACLSCPASILSPPALLSCPACANRRAYWPSVAGCGLLTAEVQRLEATSFDPGTILRNLEEPS